jgi:hypothetical protein
MFIKGDRGIEALVVGLPRHLPRSIVPTLTLWNRGPKRLGLCQQRNSHSFVLQPGVNLPLFHMVTILGNAIDILEGNAGSVRRSAAMVVAKAISCWKGT